MCVCVYGCFCTYIYTYVYFGHIHAHLHEHEYACMRAYMHAQILSCRAKERETKGKRERGFRVLGFGGGVNKDKTS